MNEITRRRFLPWLLALLLLIFLFWPLALPAQDKKPPTIAELKKDLTIISLRIENMELRYRNLKTFKERLETRISKLEEAAGKKVDDKKPK